VKVWVLRLQASLTELPPQQVPLLLSVGLVLGVFPIMGIPTVLCLIAAFVLRLNAVALQVLNNITSPLQIALLLPLAHVGSRLCGASMATHGSWTEAIGFFALHAVTGWICICPAMGAIIYFTLLLIMRRGSFRLTRKGEILPSVP
jgi:uncharacterized protein (DUF2062 family)